MKKLLAILTALTVLALPLSGLALTTSSTPVPGSAVSPVTTEAPAAPAEPETPAVPENPAEPADPVPPVVSDHSADPAGAPGAETVNLPDLIPASFDFFSKYMAEGQRLVTDATLTPGDLLLQSLAEEGYDAAVKDLLSAMTLEVTAQQTEGLSQAAFRLLLNNETAEDLIVAVNENGLYFTSGFLGNRIINMSPDQLASLANSATQQMIEEGSLDQADLDTMSEGIQTLSEVLETLSQPFTLDSKALEDALDALGEATPPEALTEVPEGLSIQATQYYTVTLTKKALTNVTTELASLLWSVPAVPKLAPLVGEEDWTKENLISALNRIPAILQEDLVLTVYTDETEENVEIHAAPKLLQEGEIVTLGVVLVVNSAENGVALSSTLDVPQGENLFLRTTATLSMSEDQGINTLEWYDTVSQISGESEFVQSAEVLSAVWAAAETDAAANVTLFSAVVPSPGESAVTQVMDFYMEAQDLGDHAEAIGTVKIGISDPGDLMTINLSQTTDLGEAYIATADAIQPTAMNEKEQEEFAAQVTFSAALEALRLITRLPASVQTLIWRSLFSPEETGILVTPGT